MATDGETRWPPAGRNDGHKWGISWPPVGRNRWPLTARSESRCRARTELDLRLRGLIEATAGTFSSRRADNVTAVIASRMTATSPRRRREFQVVECALYARGGRASCTSQDSGCPAGQNAARGSVCAQAVKERSTAGSNFSPARKLTRPAPGRSSLRS